MMVRKSKEADAAYMRKYRKRKKQERDEIEILLAEARKQIAIAKEHLQFHENLRGMWEDLALNIVNLEA